MKVLQPMIAVCMAIFGLLSCQNKLKNEDINPKFDPTHYVAEIKKDTLADFFKATGNEPFWAITISKEQITFSIVGEGNEEFVFAYAEPIRVADANIKRYRLASATATLDFTIAQGKCSNTMSGKTSPYTVKADFKRNTGTKVTTLEGCGHYIVNYRLHDIWVLENLGNQKITATDFDTTPMLEIKAAEASFMGNGGCNTIRGKLFAEQDLLRFTDIISTRMMCGPTNKEPQFLKALESSTKYEIKDNRLFLSNPNGIQLIFKKVD